MLAWAILYIRLEWTPLPCPENLRLDNWFLGSERNALPRSAPVPFFPEVHEKITKLWKTPFSGRTRFAGSSALTTLMVLRGSGGGECDCGAFMPTKYCHLEESSEAPFQGI